MKPSLDSDEEEELGALQKTLRGDVYKQKRWCCPQNCNVENDITENQSINQFIHS